MPVKTNTESQEKKVSEVRGEICEINGKTYFIRAPKAKDMMEIEKKLEKYSSTFAQGLLTIAHLCDDLTFEELSEMYVDELNPLFAVFDKLMPAK